MDRAKEFLESLKRGAPSGACGTSGSEIDWRREYDKLRNEVEIYKRWVQSETEAELAGVELRWSQLQTEAETMKRTLESENRDLSRQKIALERQVMALREELEETRLMSHEQIKHGITLKRQLQETCTTLELKVEEKEKMISTLTLHFSESKSRNERMHRELLELADQNEQLISQTNQTRLMYNANLDEFAVQCNRMLEKVAAHYNSQLKTVVSNYVGVSDELVKSKDEMSGILREMKSKEDELQNIARREKTMVSEKIREAISKLQELAAERDSALEAQAEAQKGLQELEQTASELSSRLAKHHHNSINLCRNALVILGEEMGPERVLNDDDESVVDYDIGGVDYKDVHRDVSNLTTALDREEARLKYVIKAMLSWKIRSEEKLKQFQSRIEEMEKTAIEEKNKQAYEFNKIFEQSKKYKKLVQKLRERSCAREEKVTEPPELKGSTQLKSAHATIGHLDVRAAVAKSLEAYEIKPVPTSTSSTSCGGNQVASHLHASEYKRILDDADHVRKRVDRAPPSSKTSTERHSKTISKYRKSK